jgi:hypothetical protein
MKSVLQSQQAGLEFAVSGVPNAEFLVMLLTVKLSESFQLVDLDVAALDSALQRRAKLVHLAIVLHREDFFISSVSQRRSAGGQIPAATTIPPLNPSSAPSPTPELGQLELAGFEAPLHALV